MPETTLLALEHLDANTLQPEIPYNESLDSLDEILAGTTTIDFASDADYTLGDTGNPREWQAKRFNMTDTGVVLTTGRNVVFPDNRSNVWFVNNQTAQTLTFKTASGTGVAVPASQTAAIMADDSNNMVEIVSFYDGTAVAITGGTIDGTVIGGTTPAAGNFTNVTVTGTVDGRDVAADGSKLDGIEAGADVTDTANVTAAGALMLSGGTMTGDLTLAGAPSSALHAASKSYVDSATQGITWKSSVRAATTAAGTLATDFENGDTIDGVTLATGDRILIKNQSAAAENGIYTVNASGAPTRAVDMDLWDDEVPGAACFVNEGTANADTVWLCTADEGGTLDTTAIDFTQMSTGASYTADGLGIELVATEFQLELDGSTLSKSASGLKVAAGGITDTEIGTLSAVDIDGGTIDGTVIGGTTPAAGTFTTLVSTGIADNATGARFDLRNGELRLGAGSTDFFLRSLTNTRILSLTGGTTLASGASVDLYGGAHATDPNDVKFRADAATTLHYDHSAGVWDFQGKNIATTGNVDGRDVSADGSKLDGIEAGADVTDTANVTAAGALMDSEVDADLKTLTLPANTTITAAAATVLDDATTAAMLSTLGGLPLAGGTMTGDIVLAGAPTATLHPASKGYVDTAVQGLGWKDGVRAATTAAGTLATDFENGDTIDGVTLATGDRILIKNQAAAAENGIYTVNASGAPTRAVDMDAWSEVPGAACFVHEGTVNADTAWFCTSNEGGTLETTAITITQFNIGSIYSADGQGIELTGSQFSLELDGATLSKSGSGLKVANTGIGTGQIADGAVTLAKQANMATASILGRNTAGSGAPEVLTPAQARGILGSAYTMHCGAGATAPSSGSTLHFGNIFALAQQTNEPVVRAYIPTTGTLKKAFVMVSTVGTIGTGETSSIYFRLNNTTDTLISSSLTTNSATAQLFSNTGLSVSVTEGDFFTIKWVCPTWATAPTNTLFRAVLWITH